MSTYQIKPPRLADFVADALAGPADQWLLTHMMPAKGLTFISGRPKQGKSFVAYLMGMSLGSGRQIGPFSPTIRAPALYLDLEGVARETARRFACLSIGHNIALSDIDMYFLHGQPFFLGQAIHRQALIDYVGGAGIKAVFIDPFARTFQGDENSSEIVGRIIADAQAVQQATGAGIAIVHHTNKASYKNLENTDMDPDGGMRGSGALGGAYDSIISVQTGPVEGSNQQVIIYGGKYRSFEYRTMHMESVKDENKEYVRTELKFGPACEDTIWTKNVAEKPKF